MPRIAFIGLGNMGSGMAANLAKAGHDVRAFDLSSQAVASAVKAGIGGAASAAEAVKDADAVITMLPAGQHVSDVYKQSILPNAPKDAVLIDCSTIDVETARALSREAGRLGFVAAEAPVSGGTAAAAAGTLTFMVGCFDRDFAAVEQLLRPMAKTIIHAGEPGAGQAAKICNNMLLGISMIATCEAFALAEKLGLSAQRFFDIASKSSGQCWSLTSYSPWPGLVPTAPSNRNYEGGFAVAMMLKDLSLAQEGAASTGADTPLGRAAETIYAKLAADGLGKKDFSVVLETLRTKSVS